MSLLSTARRALGRVRVWSDLDEGSPSHLTLDLTCPFELAESSTPGHAHLYLDVKVDWSTYVGFLTRLETARVIERGYLDMTLRRGASHLRLPWTDKHDPDRRKVPRRPRMPGTLDRTPLTWRRGTPPWSWYQYQDSESDRRTEVPATRLTEADLVSSALVGAPGWHGPLLDLDHGAHVDPLSGRLVLHLSTGPRSHDRVRRAFADLGVLDDVEDGAPPPLPRHT